MRTCKTCGASKPLADYPPDGRYKKDGLSPSCGPCVETRRAATAARGRRQTRRLALRNNYGLTPKQLAGLTSQQGDRCAICGQVAPLHIDHDHACCPGVKTCGACIRGLLCGACNRVLGLARDDADVLDAAAAYLRKRGV